MSVLRTLKRLTSDAYVATLAGPNGQRVNNAVLHMALRARGYGYSGGIEETGESSFISCLARQDADLCIDVGANRGEYSRTLLQATRGTVIAFEPHPRTFGELGAIRERHSDRFIAVNQGVADVEGELELCWGDNLELASFSKEVLAIGYVGACNVHRSSVPVTTLDAYFAGPGRQLGDREITLLKIDTEGFEFEVLKGARQTLRERPPKFVQVEINHHQLFRGHTLFSLSRLLADYRPYQILPGRRGLQPVAPEDPLVNIFGYANFVLVRPDVKP